jgi:Domain of unknown function (DUF4398)
MSRFLLAAAVFVGAGCAHQPPTKSLEQSKAAIRAAEEVGAEKLPQAALHLQLAREESDRARELIAHDHNQEAASYLERAEADADLAVAITRANQERSDADAAAYRTRELKTQINR